MAQNSEIWAQGVKNHNFSTSQKWVLNVATNNQLVTHSTRKPGGFMQSCFSLWLYILLVGYFGIFLLLDCGVLFVVSCCILLGLIFHVLQFLICGVLQFLAVDHL